MTQVGLTLFSLVDCFMYICISKFHHLIISSIVFPLKTTVKEEYYVSTAFLFCNGKALQTCQANPKIGIPYFLGQVEFVFFFFLFFPTALSILALSSQKVLSIFVKDLNLLYGLKTSKCQGFLSC